MKAIQSDAVINFVKFICALVRYCYYANINDILVYCLGHLYGPDRLNTLHLLVKIKATELISFYRGRADLTREPASQEHMPPAQRYKGWVNPDFPDISDLMKIIENAVARVQIMVDSRRDPRLAGLAHEGR